MNNEPNKQYTLTLNQTQADLVVKALDLFSRIGLGQFETLLEVYDTECRLELEQRELLRSSLNLAKQTVGHPVNGSFGINNPLLPERFRDAWDICQVVRHRLAWDRKPEGGIQVWFDNPYFTGKLPPITIKNED